jgi:hypothetical protein
MTAKVAGFNPRVPKARDEQGHRSRHDLQPESSQKIRSGTTALEG